MAGSASDEEEIRRTLARYCQLCDDGRFAEWGELFAPDARFWVAGRGHDGRDAIRAFIEAGLPPERRGKHVATSPLIVVDGDDARAWTDYVFVGRGLDGLAVTNAGRYHDHLRRHGERWRFTLREIVFLGDTPAVTSPPPA
jgi:3-phenylpropionate/cinnamic acid dioxygenase small subunit